MYSLDQKIAQRGYTSAEIARRAGVRTAAVSDYRARRYDKCGRTAKKKIDRVLMDLGIKARPDPKARIRRKLRRFHGDANDARLIADLTSGPLQDPAFDVPASSALREELFEQIFGVIR